MIGIDVVDVERFRAALERSPNLPRRLFTDEERAYCTRGSDPVRHMAGTLAAKEAVIKALALGNLAAWARRVEVRRETGWPTSGSGWWAATRAGQHLDNARRWLRGGSGDARSQREPAPEGAGRFALPQNEQLARYMSR